MLVSLSWLRTLCSFDEGPDRVADALTARGLTVDAVSRVGDDTVFDVDVPANRPDCLGHIGFARELSAAFGADLVPRTPPPAATGDAVDRVVEVHIDDPALCPRYTARLVRGVRVGPSPRWVVERLEACGLRSINNVVDASNLVLMELGHPIHTFDLELLEGPAVRVRRAAAGERNLTTLDGEKRELHVDDVVIADARRPVALAGIMGGADTEIHAGTTQVLIEAASFLPKSVRATSRRLGLNSDASHRFERGVDPEGLVEAQNMAVRLLHELAAGEPAPGIADVYPGPRTRRELTLRPERVRLLLGFDPGPAEIHGALEALGLAPRTAQGGSRVVTVPSWRTDLEREADLVEEVARHVGYDRIPVELPPSPGAPIPVDPAQAIEERARDLLGHGGFHEAVNYAMIGEGEDDPFVPTGSPAPIRLTNPIAEPLALLRRSLLPGLIRSADLNLRRGLRDVRLFEVGCVFLARPGGGLPFEPLRAALVWAGAAGPRHWRSDPVEVSFHDVSGQVASVLDSLRRAGSFERQSCPLPGLHPGRSLTWADAGGRPVASLGELHPAIRQSLDLPAPLFLAEIDLSILLEIPTPIVQYSAIPRVPAVSRDLSLVLPGEVGFETVLAALESVEAPAPVRFEVIDRYTGEPLGPGEVSVTVRAILQPQERTLTDESTEAYRRALVEALADRAGVRLRT